MKRGLIALILIAALFLSSCKPDMSPERIAKDTAGAMNDCANSPTSVRGDCYKGISVVLQTANQDIAFQACSSIQDESIKKGCHEELFKAQTDSDTKLSLCIKLNIPDLKQKCLEEVSAALRTVNPDKAFDVCSLMDDPQNSENSPKGDCIRQLINAQSSSDVKLSICRKIENGDWKRTCIEELANEEKDPKKAIEICNEIADDNNFRQHCYKGVEDKSSNLNADVRLSLCDAKSGYDKDNCYRSIAEELLDTDPVKSIEICNKISDKNTKSNCQNNFMSSPELVKANQALAISICDAQSIATKSRCYNDLARSLSGSNPKQAAEICKRLSDDVQISDCYGNAWFFSNQLVIDNYDFTVSLCNFLTLKKDDCLRRTAAVFMDIDRPKAEATCKLMSASISNGCLQGIER